MKHKNGITLISLVITMFILIMLAGVTIRATSVAYENARVTGFVAKMNLIQEQVNVANIKKINGDETVDNLGEDIPQSQLEQILNILGSNDYTGFRYFTSSDLGNDLGLSGIDDTVIINFETRQVYSLSGVKYNGEMYYTQYDLPNGQYNIGYSLNNINNIKNTDKDNNSTLDINIEIEKLNYGLYATLNVNVDDNTKEGVLYYGLEENGVVNSWSKMTSKSVSVTQSGKYNIKFEDKLGNTITKTTEVVLVNKPVLADGMVPVIYDEEKSSWIEVSQTDGNWYDYSEKKWANIMLEDGSVQSGSASMFVWIPRFAYNITSNFHSSETGNIDIKFLQGTTNYATDKSSIVTADYSSGTNKWIIHPAFINGGDYAYVNSGWKEAITGMWVAKFEASSNESGFIKIIPDVSSWGGLTEEQMFAKCIQMNKGGDGGGNIYHLSSNAITHQMKNSEWGAVAYLGFSKYGKDGELDVNNNSAYITGNGYKSGGLAGSTTGNVYGIYDLSGGLRERVAAYVKGGVSKIETNDRYLVDVYENDYSRNSSRFGDAMYETSSTGVGTSSWNNDESNFPTIDDPFFSRGGLRNETIKAGIFAFSTGDMGQANNEYGFRPVIIVSN